MARLLLVDDSPFVLAELGRIVETAGGFEIVGRAGNGASALELADRLRPDLVSLDVDMPVLNGLATLKQLMTRRPVATVMLSALTSEESPITFECLRLGALDFLEKPSGRAGRDLALQQREIVDRLRGAAAVDPLTLRCARMRRPSPAPHSGGHRPPRRLVVATGGRGALAPLLRLLNHLPSGGGVALVAHLDLRPAVLRPYAEYARRFSAVPVAQADESPLAADSALLVGPGRAALLLDDGDGPRLTSVAPPGGIDPERAIEYLFLSAAQLFGSDLCAVALAGAPAGTVEGLRTAAAAASLVASQSPASAADPGILRQLAAAGLGPGLDPLALAARISAWASRGTAEAA